MLRVKPAIPVHFAVVEAEYAVFLPNLDVHVVWAGEDLVGECAIYGGGGVVVYGGCFVNHGADAGVFVEEDAGDEGLVGEILGAQIQVSWEIFE